MTNDVTMLSKSHLKFQALIKLAAGVEHFVLQTIIKHFCQIPENILYITVRNT